MLFRETVAVYCESHTEHTGTLCGLNALFKYVKTGGILCGSWLEIQRPGSIPGATTFFEK
jgi:hypothetical protein